MSVYNANETTNKPLHLVMPIVKGMVTMNFVNNGAIPGLFGDAGIGKTANIKQMCVENDWNLLDIHYGLKPLEEISGLPDFGTTVDMNGVNIKKTHWTLPDIVGDAYELSKNGKPTVIFLDDFHTASPGNMALGYEMFTSKKLRGYSFPQNTAFILAANVSGAKSLANPIPAPIMNRIAKFNVTVDFNQWKVGFAIPNKINNKILAFLSNPKYQKYFQTEEIVNQPWSSARAWTNFSSLLNPMEQYNADYLKVIDPYYLAKSFIDDESALNFSKYYVLFGEINTKEIFNGTEKIIIPDDMQKRFIFILACIDEFISRYTNPNITPDIKVALIHIMCNIILEIAKVNSEIAVVGLKEILLLQKGLKLKGLYNTFEKQLNVLNSEITARILNDVTELVG